MKKYSDFDENDIDSVDFTQFKIIVPSTKYKKELMEAFKHIHGSNIDTEFVTVNQLAHEYINDEISKGSYNNIIVDFELFEKLKNIKG